MYRTHTCGELRTDHVGKEVALSGWVHKRRDLGGLIFVDLRDRYGKTQILLDPEVVAQYEIAEGLKYEYIIKVVGEVILRDEKVINTALDTGKIELKAKSIEVLSKAKTMPFEIFETDKGEEDEELRLKYRFLELRREKLKNNIIFRSKVIGHIRSYMEERNFIDIATPILTVSSPEGARDFLVPSRIHPGKFYALPQAPQQYKQLLMIAGFDRYYQIAPCMRDEDPRADRSPGEFYQLDCETSFMTSEEFFQLMEPLFIELTEKVAGKKVLNNPFPRIPFKECMETYGSDRPDLRFDLKIQEITDWAKETDFKVFNSADHIRVLVVPGGNEFSRKEIDGEFTDAAKRAHAKGLAWTKYVNGTFEGGVSKFFTPEQLEALTAQLSLNTDSILFFGADNWEVSATGLGAVRHLVGDKMNLKDPNLVAWAWIVDFPMYEWDKEREKVDFGHNPFSMPKGGMKALETQEPLDILADQYDIIANGLELSSGAVRNKDPEVMYKAFEIAGYTKEAVDKEFGHMIGAFKYGAPPHCGFAPGIERLIMLLTGEENIRRVVAFPKNQKAEEPMIGSPAVVKAEQLDELGLSILDTIVSK
ncbi:MAG: aspartate--tRNA ligase [Candidatus Magasanikbacteria bacterium]|jgi:aspartyl-tRNA synthetase|nr:aspartate--tRNA ligase [Candidatus Magasanikbacteria bacterium]MBT4071267.1 aspartate--tRNA ligase [Candidatus Magasanikbacteria bacterium]